MKGKGDRLTYWLIGEDPSLKEERSRERESRRSGDPVGMKKSQDPLVPRSSLKNKSLTRTTFLRCSSESPKRLRFASSDQLDQKGTRDGKILESIVDNSPCKGKGVCSARNNCMGSTRSSSNSCPCVEKLCDSESPEQECREKANVQENSPLIFGTDSCVVRSGSKCFRFGAPGIFQVVCRSAPSSPHHSSTLLDLRNKRGAQSNEEIDAWDASTPLIGSTTSTD